MRYVLIFLVGLLLGANALYFALRQGWVPLPRSAAVIDRDQTPPQTVTPAPIATTDPGNTPAQTQPNSVPTPQTPQTAIQTSPSVPQPGSREWWLARNSARQHTAPSTPSPPGATKATNVATAPVLSSPGSLLIPVQNIKSNQLHDTFKDARSENRVHDAIDIMAPTGTPVFATDDGRVVKLFNSKLGGITLYQFDPSETYVYYYAHLDRYADGMVEGKQLKRGEVIGYVGYTGNANPEGPHLHFAVSVLGPEKQWWKATALNPYPLLVGQR